MGRSTRSPVRWPTTGPGQGFWTKEFILIELIAPELDWFQVCLAHHHFPPYFHALDRKNCSGSEVFTRKERQEEEAWAAASASEKV